MIIGSIPISFKFISGGFLISISFKDEQPKKTHDLISLIEDEIWICFNDEQPWNALHPMNETEERLIDFSEQ